MKDSVVIEEGPQQMRGTPNVREFDARLAALQQHYADRPSEVQDSTERARDACAWAGTQNPWVFLGTMAARR